MKFYLMSVNRRKDSIAVSESHPHLVKEWHPTLNALTPDDIAAGGKHIIWWIGELCGHVWDANIRDRAVKSHGCPYCSNQRLLVDYNDMATTHPVLAKEWHPTLNGELMPKDVQAGTARKAWWYRKECGHSWESSIRRRANGAGCNVCLSRTLVVGVNDFATLFPQLTLEWDECNLLEPHEVTKGNRSIIWWKCHLGHRWKQPIFSRASKQAGCPVCENRQVLAGFNDLATTHPLLAAEWDYGKNGLLPTEVIAGSHVSAHWKCSHGHQWKTAIVHRSTSGTGCPVCTNRVILPGCNDLATTHPYLLAEWDYEKNSKSPTEVGPGYVYAAWWRCTKDKNHSWQSIVKNRVKGDGCPLCHGSQTSKVEQAFRDFIGSHLTIERTDHLARITLPGYKRKVQVDILAQLKSSKLIIEYDGYYYHKDKVAADMKKTESFLAEGYTVIRIRESGLDDLIVSDDSLLQISYRWSLNSDKIEAAGNTILNWLDKRQLR
jgi:hypothetical protein